MYRLWVNIKISVASHPERIIFDGVDGNWLHSGIAGSIPARDLKVAFYASVPG
jgi:hypothetical protein